MSIGPVEKAKTTQEIYELADRSQQVIESARLMEYALREYSGDYRSGLTQLYNTCRKIFPEGQRAKIKIAFEARSQLRNVEKNGEATFEAKTKATETFLQAANFLFASFPKIYPDKFTGPSSAVDQATSFFDEGSQAETSATGSNISALSTDNTDVDKTNTPFVPPTYSLQGSGLLDRKLSIFQMEKICHRMGRSLKAGISISVALENEEKLLSGSQREAFSAILVDVSNGGTAADAVSRHHCFPSMFSEMVRVGEETGRLDQAFLRLADHYRNLIQMRRTFIQGISWPVLQFIFAIGVISLFFLIIAWLESIMTEFQAPDIFMLGFSPMGNLGLLWILILLGLGGLFIAIKGTVAGWFGEFPIQLALRIPLIGNTIKTLSLSRFAWSFGMAIEAGMDAKRAIQLGVRSTQMHYYMAHEDAIGETISEGKEFAVALGRTDAFPADLLQAVEVGELTGELTESLERLSNDYCEQAEISLRRISQISGFVITIFVAVIIAVAVFLMYANYLGTLNEALKNPMGTLEQIENGEKSSNPTVAAKNKMVKDFMENNDDFKQFKSLYEHLPNINKMSPNEFLDGF